MTALNIKSEQGYRCLKKVSEVKVFIQQFHVQAANEIKVNKNYVEIFK